MLINGRWSLLSVQTCWVSRTIGSIALAKVKRSAWNKAEGWGGGKKVYYELCNTHIERKIVRSMVRELTRRCKSPYAVESDTFERDLFIIYNTLRLPMTSGIISLIIVDGEKAHVAWIPRIARIIYMCISLPVARAHFYNLVRAITDWSFVRLMVYLLFVLRAFILQIFFFPLFFYFIFCIQRWYRLAHFHCWNSNFFHLISAHSTL